MSKWSRQRAKNFCAALTAQGITFGQPAEMVVEAVINASAAGTPNGAKAWMASSGTKAPHQNGHFVSQELALHLSRQLFDRCMDAVRQEGGVIYTRLEYKDKNAEDWYTFTAQGPTPQDALVSLGVILGVPGRLFMAHAGTPEEYMFHFRDNTLCEYQGGPV